MKETISKANNWMVSKGISPDLMSMGIGELIFFGLFLAFIAVTALSVIVPFAGLIFNLIG